MRYVSVLLFLLFSGLSPNVYSQQKAIDKIAFFKDTGILNVTLVTDMGRMIKRKMNEGEKFPAKCIIETAPDYKVEANIDMEARGRFRKQNCYLPPLKLIFNKDSNAPTAKLKTLKLVTACNAFGEYDQYVLKEYLVYRMYNLLTEKSLRTRLFNLEYEDTDEKKRTTPVFAFLLEDLDDAAKRVNCREWEGRKLPQETTDRKQMTLVSLFQYMIGNTDWSVLSGHNLKLIASRTDANTKPYPIAYDFDFSGLVNTTYASPDPMFNSTSVTERIYRGYPRTMEELDEALEVFKQQKDNIYALINNMNQLTARNKKNMTSYLDEFYTLIQNPKKIKSTFIKHARAL